MQGICQDDLYKQIMDGIALLFLLLLAIKEPV